MQFNEHKVLADAGKVFHEVAKQLAEDEYQKFDEQRRIDQANVASDFDVLVSKSKTLPSK